MERRGTAGMSRRLILTLAGAVLGLGLLAWGVTSALDRLMRPRVERSPAETAADVPMGHITATLFYASDDGQALVPVQREVPLAEGIVAQGHRIVEAQLAPPPSPYRSVIPAGTTLRALYVTERGDAFIDLSPELRSAHPGGSLTELLTVYAIVNAVTANLPAVKRVQILVDGREVDTIAGHIDIRRPLEHDTTLVRSP
jgi:spore germination protein GerM